MHPPPAKTPSPRLEAAAENQCYGPQTFDPGQGARTSGPPEEDLPPPRRVAQKSNCSIRSRRSPSDFPPQPIEDLGSPTTTSLRSAPPQSEPGTMPSSRRRSEGSTSDAPASLKPRGASFGCRPGLRRRPDAPLMSEDSRPRPSPLRRTAHATHGPQRKTWRIAAAGIGQRTSRDLGRRCRSRR